MDDLEQNVKHALERALVDVGRRSSPPRNGVRRVVIRRVALTGSVVVALVCGAVVGVNVVSSVAVTDARRETVGPATTEPSEENVPAWRGPTVALASGRARGQEWSLTAFRARFDDGAGPVESLCAELIVGTAATGSGVACTDGWGATMDAAAKADVMIHYAGPIGVTAVYGRVPAAVQEITLSLDDGTTIPARVASPPPELGVDYDFFVALAPYARADGELVGSNGRGDVLFRQAISIYQH